MIFASRSCVETSRSSPVPSSRSGSETCDSTRSTSPARPTRASNDSGVEGVGARLRISTILLKPLFMNYLSLSVHVKYEYKTIYFNRHWSIDTPGHLRDEVRFFRGHRMVEDQGCHFVERCTCTLFRRLTSKRPSELPQPKLQLNCSRRQCTWAQNG